MKKTIPLSAIVSAMEEAAPGDRLFYNVATGEVCPLPSPEAVSPGSGLAGYAELPPQEDLHESKIMEGFAREKGSEPLLDALRGTKPLRLFRERAAAIGLDGEYRAFRSAAIADLARAWCWRNAIPFTEPGKSSPITVNLYYTGVNGAARRFAEEMEASGTAEAIRREDGNLRYEYFLPLADPETVLLIDSWRDQAAIDAHHASPMMHTVALLRDKYDLHMRAERYVAGDEADGSFLRK